MIPKLGEVHIPCDADFKSVKEMCVNNEGWTLDMHKKNVKLWLKKTDLCPYNKSARRVGFLVTYLNLFELHPIHDQ
jgi:hypothetical protein